MNWIHCAGWGWLEPGPGEDGRVVSLERLKEFKHPGLRRADRVSRLMSGAAARAHQQAGWDQEGPEGDTVAIYGATELGPTRATHAFLAKVRDRSPALADPAVFPNLVVSAPAGYLSLVFGWRGPSTTFVQHGMAVMHALDRAARDLEQGRARAVVVAAAEEWCGERSWVEGLLGVAGRGRHSRAARVAGGEGSAALCLQSNGPVVLSVPQTSRIPGVRSTRFCAPREALIALWERALSLSAWPDVDCVYPSVLWAAGVEEGSAFAERFPHARCIDLDPHWGQWPTRPLAAVALAAADVASGRHKRVLVSCVGRGGGLGVILVGSSSS